MPTVYPFRAFRPKPELAQKVATPPYDVVTRDEAKALAKDNPQSFLHVTRSEIDLPDGTDPYSDQVYAQAKKGLDKLEKDGVLVQDKDPAFYVYEMRDGTFQQTGFAFTLPISDYDSGVLKKHELTRPEKENDRVKHIEVTGAQTGKVFALHRERQALSILARDLRAQKPAVEFNAADGVRHRLWVVSDPKQQALISEEFKQAGSLYIADGHHRAAAASRVAEARRKQGAKADDPSQRLMVVSVSSVFARTLPYHRIVKDLGNLAEPHLLRMLEEQGFHVKQDRPTKSQPKQFGLCFKGLWFTVTARPGTWDDKDPVARLDATILQDRVLKNILGINDPRTDERIDFVGGKDGVAKVEKKLRTGYAVGFTLHPTSVDELLAVADAGKLMPPKSTWFDPKLRDAMLIHHI